MKFKSFLALFLCYNNFMKTWINNKKIDISFISIEVILYILILFADLDGWHRFVSFMSIFVCFVYVLLIHKKNDMDYNIMRLAFIATLAADYFLTLHSEEQVLGTFLFFLSQVMFFFRIHLSYQRIKPKIIYLYTAVFSIFVLMFYLILESIDVLIIVSLLYFSFLLLNMIFSWMTHKRYILFTIGLTCYIAADLMVAMHMADPYITFATPSIFSYLTSTPINLIWLFYLPTQVLLALSTKYHHKEAF